MDAHIKPEGSLELLSHSEISQLYDTGTGGLYELWRQCALAVLRSGIEDHHGLTVSGQDDQFKITILQQERGVELELTNAPDLAFVDGHLIKGIQEHLFSLLRDLVYVDNEILTSPNFDLSVSEGITDTVLYFKERGRIEVRVRIQSCCVLGWP